MKFRIGDEKHEFDEAHLEIDEAMRVKVASGRYLDNSGYGLAEFFGGLLTGDPIAVCLMVWLTRIREGESTLQFADVHFDFADFEVLPGDGETDAEADPHLVAEVLAEAMGGPDGGSSTRLLNGAATTRSRSRKSSTSGRGKSGG